MTKISRRELLFSTGTAAGAALLPFSTSAAPKSTKFEFSLNMSTIMGQKLGFIKELEIASAAGYKHCEIWVPTLEAYLKSGGTLVEAKKRINDLGINIQNAIGFAQWIVDDEATRKQGVEQMKREMGMLAELGCFRTAAPPMGATKEAGLDLRRAAERYRTILDVGTSAGVTPQLEMWGHSKNLNRVADVLFVAAEAGQANAKLLLDVFHIYKGESSIDCLHLVGENSIDVFHVNDYVTTIKPTSITDGDRIYAGDGEAPIKEIIKRLKPSEKPVILSLELFNKELWAQDPLKVAKTGLDKMKSLI
ncbi:sugar phosphate isomerase/epimerase family protein [Aquirufa novilacunae]|jgi:sugar phosphate isomerase/epimerase|uniref:Sugar phosphate isomerase/epimerase family protein n=1 Tax=Aquirufa novilacunae TaxID=3139305 RepID=A0ABW8U306_9BACT